MLMPENLYTSSQRSQLSSREDRISADRTNDALIELAQLKNPQTIWIRLHWTQKPDRENDCCGGGIFASEDSVVLRFKTQPFPPQLSGYIDPRKEWKEFSKDLDLAMKHRQPCISKCCSIITFILLFYLTIIGIFFYMCAEVGCAQRGRKKSKKALNDVIEQYNDKWKEKGIEIVGRWHPDRDEGEDMPDEDTWGEFQFICIKLPQPPASFYAQQQQQAYQMQIMLQQQQQHQQMLIYAQAQMAQGGAVMQTPTAPYYTQQQTLNPVQLPQNYQQYTTMQSQQPQEQFFKHNEPDPTSPSGDPTI